MKRITSRIIIIFMIIIMLFEIPFSSNISYAFDSKDINAIVNLVGGLVSLLLWFKRIQVTAIAWVMGTILTDQLAESCGTNFTSPNICATPFDIFFNTYKLFDVNFFDIPSGNGILSTIRSDVAKWFYILRTISAAILLVILVYVGIRMAISTIAEDKAKYKKMFWDWCCSLALIFVLQYIAIMVIEINNAIVNFLRNYGGSQIQDTISDIMWEAMKPMGIGSLVATVVYCMIIFQIIAFMLIYIKRMIKVGFLIIISPMISLTYSIDKIGDGKAQALNKWLKEFIYTILIQPFHCIMYLAFVGTAIGLLDSGVSMSSIANDGMWNAIGNMNQLANGFLAILCLKFINDGEKAIRKIFNFQDDDKMTSLAAGAVMGMAAINGAKKIGQTTAKGVNSAKNISTKFKNAKAGDAKSGAFGKLKGQLGKAKDSFKNTTNAIKDTKIGGALSKAGSKIGDSKLGQLGKSAIEKGKFAGGKITNAGKFVGGKAKAFKAKADKLKGKVNDYKSKFEKNHPGLAKKIKSAKTLGVNKFKSSLPLAMGMMGAAMSYATGSSGVMQAIGVGSAMSRGVGEYMASSQGTLEGNIQDNLNEDVQDNKDVQSAQKELDDNADKITEASENLKDTNNAIENMSEAEQANGNDYADLLKEEDELGTRQAELQGKQNLSSEEEKELAEIQKRQAEIANRKQKLKDDPEIAKVLPVFEKKHNLEKQLSQEKGKRGNLQAKAKEARKKAAQDMIKKYENNGSSAQIAKAKAEILKKLQMCMMESKYKDSQGDVSMDYSLSDKETRSAQRMQESICALVDRAVIAGGGRLDSGQVLKRYFGEDTNSPMAQSLMQAIDTYQFQARAKNYNDNEELYKNSGGTKEKFREDVSTKASKHG